MLFGETSSAKNRKVTLASAWGSIEPWCWGYYSYDPQGGTAGCLTIDSKFVRYPINYSGAYLVNDMPYTSSHTGGAMFAFCDGSIRFLKDSTPVNLLQGIATRANGEVVDVQ